MAITILQHVNPGDIIASDLVNYLIDKVLEYEQRLTNLELVKPSGPVVINTFDPQVQQAIGQVLGLNGAGFIFPPDQNLVKLDDVQVTAFRPSTSARLEFIVPPLTNIPVGGRNVVVSVQNASGGAQRLYRIMPSVPVVGNPPTISGVIRADGAGGPLTPAQDALIQGTNFSATGSENLVTMRFTVVDPLTGLAKTTTIPRQPSDPPITVTQPTATQIRVTVPLMPELPLNQNVTLTVQVTVGAQPPAVANTIVRRLT